MESTQLIKGNFCKEGVAVAYETYEEKIIIAAELIKAGISAGSFDVFTNGYLCSYKEGDKWTFNDKESLDHSINIVFNTVHYLNGGIQK